MNKKIIISIVAVILIIISVVFYYSKKDMQKSPETVLTTPEQAKTPELATPEPSSIDADLNAIDGENFEADITNINEDINGL